MLGGGKWQTQNKILPGTYINFAAKKKGKGKIPSVNTPEVVLLSSDDLILKDLNGVFLIPQEG